MPIPGVYPRRSVEGSRSVVGHLAAPLFDLDQFTTLVVAGL